MSDWPSEYACAPGLHSASGRYRLRPIGWADREPIRQWRNEQIDVLRQDRPLTQSDQDSYYEHVVRPQFEQATPAQLLLAFLEDDELVGYGGVVHLCWPDRRGEVSFMAATSRVPESTTADWGMFLDLLIPLAREQIGLHKLTTEAYDFRTDVMAVLESRGFRREGLLAQHHRWDGRWHDSVLHGLVLEDG